MSCHGCAESERLQAYLDRTLSEAERTVLEAHLSDCSQCRRQLVMLFQEPRPAGEVEDPGVPEDLMRQVRELVPPTRLEEKAPVPVWKSKGWGLAALLLLVPALLWVADWLPTSTDVAAPGDVLRVDADNPAPKLLGPEDGARVVVGARRFSWTEIPGARRYVLWVTDSVGNPLHRLETETGALDLDLSSTGQLHWYVSVKLEDGTELHARSRRLIVESETQSGH